MPDLLTWLLVFLRAIGLLAIFPVFSANNMPVQIRIALAALVSFLVSPLVSVASLVTPDFWSVVGLMIVETGFGLLLGFASRMLFYAVEVAGGVISTEVGLMVPAGFNPMSVSPTSEMATILQYLAAMLFLTLNLHHGLLLAFQKSYQFLPMGGGHLHESLLLDVAGRTGHLFWFAVQVAAPILAVTFIISLVFSVLGRAVPQMNVFVESFSVRLLAGIMVFGLTCHLMAQHIANYLHRLPDDVLRVAQLMGMK
jgi:flagellar biosynthetic protein FliR